MSKKLEYVKCNGCLKVHPSNIDCCDECGGISFAPFHPSEGTNSIGNIIKAKGFDISKKFKDLDLSDQTGNTAKIDPKISNEIGTKEVVKEEKPIKEEKKEEVKVTKEDKEDIKDDIKKMKKEESKEEKNK